MKAAIYPGTFDPPTLGHLNIIQRAALQCGKLIIAIGENPAKMLPAFSIDERVLFLKTITKEIDNVEIYSFKGLLVDFARSQGIDVIIRAIRTIFDFEYETLQAQMNRQLGGIETFYLVIEERYRLISSTLVREIAPHGRRLHEFVAPEIEEAVFQRLHQPKTTSEGSEPQALDSTKGDTSQG
jgi:pantetheine-phosphate adenylyltransferase